MRELFRKRVEILGHPFKLILIDRRNFTGQKIFIQHLIIRMKWKTRCLTLILILSEAVISLKVFGSIWNPILLDQL